MVTQCMYQETSNNCPRARDVGIPKYEQTEFDELAKMYNLAGRGLTLDEISSYMTRRGSKLQASPNLTPERPLTLNSWNMGGGDKQSFYRQLRTLATRPSVDVTPIIR